MRYLPLTPDDRSAMLAAIGVKSIDDLFVDVPQAARREGFVDLPRVAGELEVERALGAMAAKNIAAGSAPFFCGAGAYRHHVPATVDHVIQRSEFLTSYTPYQPEIAQGVGGVLADADRGDIAFEANPLVILGEAHFRFFLLVILGLDPRIRR